MFGLVVFIGQSAMLLFVSVNLFDHALFQRVCETTVFMPIPIVLELAMQVVWELGLDPSHYDLIYNTHHYESTAIVPLQYRWNYPLSISGWSVCIQVGRRQC